MWVDATHGIVMVTHCTQLQFWAPSASQAPPPCSFIVDEFNRVDEGGCSKASETFCFTLFSIASVAACKFLT